MLGSLFLMAVLSSELNTDRFSVSKDLLPFGVPSEFSDGLAPVLTPDELVGCIRSHLSVEKARLELNLKYAKLRVEESHGIINKQKRLKSAPKDELDRQLDEIEKSVAEESSLTENTRQFLSQRTKFFKESRLFSESCGSRTYKASDVRALFPNGIPDQ